MEDLRKNAATYGLFLGLFIIVTTTLVYALDISLFTASWYGLLSMTVIIVFGAYAAIQAKKNQGGFLTFKETFTSFLVAVLVGLSISTLFSVLLFNVIDPEAKQIITDNVIKMTTEMMGKFGTKPADINAIIKEMQKTDSFGVVGQLKGFVFNIIIYSVIGLITALIIRRERPQSI
jgi:hypothetical protein